jgi:hypothetical protein
VHDERVEVVGQASGRRGVAGSVELVDQRLESLLAVMLAGGVVERLPVGPTDTVAFALGQLGQQVADAVNGVSRRRSSFIVLSGLERTYAVPSTGPAIYSSWETRPKRRATSVGSRRNRNSLGTGAGLVPR